MTRRVLAIVVCFAACSQASRPARSAELRTSEQAILALADSILAAARARDPDRFVSFFSDRPDFVYLINTRRFTSRDSLRATFASMLGRQQSFDPRWGDRIVQMLGGTSGVFTGDFETRAQRVTGEPWTARGVVTFTAVREARGWRVVNWHTTE